METINEGNFPITTQGDDGTTTVTSGYMYIHCPEKDDQELRKYCLERAIEVISRGIIITDITGRTLGVREIAKQYFEYIKTGEIND